LHLKPLPAWTPEVYRLHRSLVDIERYVALNSNRYSVPVDWIGRRPMATTITRSAARAPAANVRSATAAR
jgi:hypothetical protein